MTKSGAWRPRANIGKIKHRLARANGFGFEWLLLALWTLSVTSPLFDLGRDVSPSGREYFRAISNHFLWDRFRECGACAFWNGNIEGGYPAFADPFNAMLHPVVVSSSMAFGARDGATIALIAMFFFAGLAQWWFAIELGLGTVARLWSGGMAVAAGKLASQLDQGTYAVLVSTVAAAFVLPPLVRLCRDGSRRSAALLGIAAGLLFVAGQGYLQIGVGLLAPISLFLIVSSPFPFRLLLRRLALALGIGLLLAAPFIVPFLHFYPSFSKFLDPEFTETQSFRYIPLNLVIDNPDFFRTGSLGAPIYPYLSVNYIGWVAVLLAIIGVGALLVQRRRSLCCFLAVWAIAAMWLASASPLRWARDRTEPVQPVWEFIVGIRNPALLSALAVPTLLALGAIGLDHLWNISAPTRVRLRIDAGSRSVGRNASFDPRWLLTLVLLIGLLDARQFARSWLGIAHSPAYVATVLDTLATPGADWISPPFGEEFWVGEALERNMKLSTSVKVWEWKDRQDPRPVLEAIRGEAPADMSLVTTVDGIGIFAAPPGNEYAAVVHADGSRTPCLASSRGGNVLVHCSTEQPGQLQVKENRYSGWSANVNGRGASIESVGQWMGVDVPAGTAEIEMRYRPWDVPLGLALMLVGIIIAGYYLVRGDSRSDEPSGGETLHTEPFGSDQVGAEGGRDGGGA